MSRLYNVALAFCMAIMVASTLAQNGPLITQNPNPIGPIGGPARVAGQCAYAGSGAIQETCNNVCFNVIGTSFSLFIQPGGYCYCVA